MSVTIEGVTIVNPTMVWSQLMNTRQVLKDKESWNNSNWLGQDRAGFTMCLANAVRFVVKGSRSVPQDFSRNSSVEMVKAEQLVLAVINKRSREGRIDDESNGIDYSDIPQFNDQQNRSFHQIAGVIDEAIELLRPHTSVKGYSDESDLTAEERAEMRKAIWDAEDAMWAEYRRDHRLTKDGNGIWRTPNGRFATVPYWVRESKPRAEKFKGWLDAHEARGWDSFWDELIKCESKECEDELERMLADAAYEPFDPFKAVA